MLSSKIKENEDYAYVTHVGRSAPNVPTSSHGVYRVRVLAKGIVREDVYDEYGYRREGRRADGVRVQFLNDDGTLTERIAVVRSKNLRCPWIEYRIAKRESDQRKLEEQAIRERQQAERKARTKRTVGRLTDLGVIVSEDYWSRKDKDCIAYDWNEFRFTADGIEKLLDLIPDHIIAARLAEQEIAEQQDRIVEGELVEA